MPLWYNGTKASIFDKNFNIFYQKCYAIKFFYINNRQFSNKAFELKSR